MVWLGTNSGLWRDRWQSPILSLLLLLCLTLRFVVSIIITSGLRLEGTIAPGIPLSR